MATPATVTESRVAKIIQTEANALAAEAFTYLKEIEYWSNRYNVAANELNSFGFYQAGELGAMHPYMKSRRYPDSFHHCFAMETDGGGHCNLPAEELVEWVAHGAEPRGGCFIEREEREEREERSIHSPRTSNNSSTTNATREKRLEQLTTIGNLSQWTCTYCLQTGSPDGGPDNRFWHVDHIYPRTRGGDNLPDNLVLSCATCNLQKSAKLLTDAMAAKAAHVCQK